ncbi:MAG TPA: hypothetical protein VH278_13865 [Burkholderiaceae bacterium]|nr:hypothetical protein [Burkholderiaceae bacterium]
MQTRQRALAPIRQKGILARFWIALPLIVATCLGADACAATEVSLSRIDARLIKSFMPRSDLEVTEDTVPLPLWDDPECQERRSFDVWQNQALYATVWVWLCHSGVLGVEGFDETVRESLQNLGHGDPTQTDQTKEAEGGRFDIGGRHGRTITVVTTTVSSGATVIQFLPVAAIRSRDQTLNLAVVANGMQLRSAGDPANIESLKTVEKILRAVDALTPVGEGR